MFNVETLPTIAESVVESTDSGIELANYTAHSAANPLKMGLWVRAFNQHETDNKRCIKNNGEKALQKGRFDKSL